MSVAKSDSQRYALALLAHNLLCAHRDVIVRQRLRLEFVHAGVQFEIEQLRNSRNLDIATLIKESDEAQFLDKLAIEVSLSL